MHIKDKDRATTVKSRISGSCAQSVTQQIVRIDRETIEPLSKETEDVYGRLETLNLAL